MSTPEERYKKLQEKRDELFANTTPGQRVAQMDMFIKKMREFGETNFPNAHLRYDEENELYK